jgi:hypothetical protein
MTTAPFEVAEDVKKREKKIGETNVGRMPRYHRWQQRGIALNHRCRHRAQPDADGQPSHPQLYWGVGAGGT